MNKREEVTRAEIVQYLKELSDKFLLELPNVTAQIQIYEKKLANGELTKNPVSSPQFND